jgi:hypothetical protein
VSATPPGQHICSVGTRGRNREGETQPHTLLIHFSWILFQIFYAPSLMYLSDMRQAPVRHVKGLGEIPRL